jgi:ribose transport system ATP-binding protein
MAFVPAERLRNAAFTDMTLRENLLISNLAPVFGPLGVNKTVERREALKWLDKLEVVPRATETRLINLSGGNQQKVVLGRVLRLEPQVLVLDEPTQGVDVGAKDAIHQIVRDAAKQGTAVLVASTESEELVALCDRIIVLAGGSALGEYPVSALSPDQLTELTMRKPSGGDDEAVRRVLGL